MFNLQVTSTTMELLPLVCLCLLTRSGTTFAEEGAAPELSVTILDATNDWALLQCEVQGTSPKPKVEWQDRAGNIHSAEEPQVSEIGGRYDIILQTTVTKTDHYRCVATQEEIYHQIYAEIFVHISGSCFGWVFAGWTALAAVCGLVVGGISCCAVTKCCCTQNAQRFTIME